MDRVETKDKFKFFCKPDELLCRTYEMLLMAYGFGLISPTKSNETRIIRFFLEYIGMQSYLEPNN